MSDIKPVTRRKLLRSTGGLIAASALPGEAIAQARRGPTLVVGPAIEGAAPVEGIHLTFGDDPSREMVVSWTTAASVRKPHAELGTARGGFGRAIPAETRTYTDKLSGREVQTHHVRLTQLVPDTTYIYAVSHDGRLPEFGTFKTAPRGRTPFRFTSFGDQGVPYLTGLTPLAHPPGPVPANSMLHGFENDAIGSFAAGDVVEAVETLAPTYHLLNGDLCYADISRDRLRVWDGFFANNSRSARFRPWMPTVGNHENEGNGPIGFTAYQTRFQLPRNGEDAVYQGLWYAFTVGSVRTICINNDDVALQGLGRPVYGYSAKRQRAWLERELARSRADRSIDWIVVCMHQTMISTADLNGADLGIRDQFGPLFDRYGVDIVLCGHEHHYERSHPVRGVDKSSATLTPMPVSTAGGIVDTSQATVHFLIGGGGTSVPSNSFLFDRPECKVITGASVPDAGGRRTPIYVKETATWSAFRDKTNPYGFASFDVDPGRHPGDMTQIHATYYAVTGPGQFAAVDKITLQRRRSDRAA